MLLVARASRRWLFGAQPCRFRSDQKLHLSALDCPNPLVLSKGAYANRRPILRLSAVLVAGIVYVHRCCFLPAVTGSQALEESLVLVRFPPFCDNAPRRCGSCCHCRHWNCECRCQRDCFDCRFHFQSPLFWFAFGLRAAPMAAFPSHARNRSGWQVRHIAAGAAAALARGRGCPGRRSVCGCAKSALLRCAGAVGAGLCLFEGSGGGCARAAHRAARRDGGCGLHGLARIRPILRLSADLVAGIVYLHGCAFPPAVFGSQALPKTLFLVRFPPFCDNAPRRCGSCCHCRHWNCECRCQRDCFDCRFHFQSPFFGLSLVCARPPWPRLLHMPETEGVCKCGTSSQAPQRRWRAAGDARGAGAPAGAPNPHCSAAPEPSPPTSPLRRAGRRVRTRRASGGAAPCRAAGWRMRTSWTGPHPPHFAPLSRSCCRNRTGSLMLLPSSSHWIARPSRISCPCSIPTIL